MIKFRSKYPACQLFITNSQSMQDSFTMRYVEVILITIQLSLVFRFIDKNESSPHGENISLTVS